MQSLLFKSQNLRVFQKYLNTISKLRSNYLIYLTNITAFNQLKTYIYIYSVQFKSPFKNSNLIQPLANSLLHYKNSQPLSQNDSNRDERWKKDAKWGNENDDQDKERKRKELLIKRIGFLSMLFAFFYLNLSYLEQVEIMQKKMEEKDRELEEERRKNAAGVFTTNTTKSSNQEKIQSSKVKSTLITWNEFVNDYLYKGNVVELVANRKSELVMIK